MDLTLANAEVHQRVNFKSGIGFSPLELTGAIVLNPASSILV
jgi:hypothetical protein